MRQRQHGTRGNALWGKGTRGGDSRSRALGVVVIAVVGLVLPAAAIGKPGDKRPNGKNGKNDTYVVQSLLDQAQATPGAEFDVIIQSEGGSKGAAKELSLGKGKGSEKRSLKIVGAVSARLDGEKLLDLAKRPGLTITPDVKTRSFGAPMSFQLWPYAMKVNQLWTNDVTCNRFASFYSSCVQPNLAPPAPTIAVVDSGIEPTRADFAGRLLASVSLVSAPAVNGPGDTYGHGTFVASLAAGASRYFAGSAPTAKLVSVDVLDDNGAGRASDLIAGAQWVLEHKDEFGIKVANFSVGANSVGVADPVNKAVEALWLNGVTVVSSSGNYAANGARSNVKFAPANDPFVITVGAADAGRRVDPLDDSVAPWSAWGYTRDGFSKPDVVAPGRYMIAAVPASSALPAQRPTRVFMTGYMRLSGTSFAAAAVSGVVAQILARHPEFGPDQVKGALMLTARDLPLVTDGSEGVGEVDAAAAAAVLLPPNPNRALRQFVGIDPIAGPAFADSSWYEAARANLAWDASSWSESSWAESSWNESSWAESSWNESSWAESSWAESSWNESSWNESTWSENTGDEDAVLDLPEGSDVASLADNAS